MGVLLKNIAHKSDYSTDMILAGDAILWDTLIVKKRMSKKFPETEQSSKDLT